MKQRKDSLTIFQEQNRADLAEKEASEIAVIEKFLPVQMTEDEVKAAVEAIVKELGAAGPQDLGKVMGVASKQLAGKADGKLIAAVAASVDDSDDGSAVSELLYQLITPVMPRSRLGTFSTGVPNISLSPTATVKRAGALPVTTTE